MWYETFDERDEGGVCRKITLVGLWLSVFVGLHCVSLCPLKTPLINQYTCGKTVEKYHFKLVWFWRVSLKRPRSATRMIICHMLIQNTLLIPEGQLDSNSAPHNCKKVTVLIHDFKRLQLDFNPRQCVCVCACWATVIAVSTSKLLVLSVREKNTVHNDLKY